MVSLPGSSAGAISVVDIMIATATSISLQWSVIAGVLGQHKNSTHVSETLYVGMVRTCLGRHT